MHAAAWIGVEEAFALRDANFVAALRDGTIIAEGCHDIATDNPANWIVLPTAVWRYAIFIGEPGYPQIDGRTVADMVCVFQRRPTWWEIRVRRADVERLPKSPDLVEKAVYEELLARGREEQKEGRKLNQRAEWLAAYKGKRIISQRRYLTVFRSLPQEYRYERGEH